MGKRWIGWTATLCILAATSAVTWPADVNARSDGNGCPAEAACMQVELRAVSNVGGATVIQRSLSLGTVVAPHVILTHNHYSLLAGATAEDVMVITDTTGMSWPVPLTAVDCTALDGGTLLVRLPDDVTLPAPARLAPTAGRTPQAGDRLTIAYLQPESSAIQTGSFEVTQVVDGLARLADPQHLIEPGASGGGAIFDGMLVGNTWSIDVVDGQPMGAFTVALLPATLGPELRRAAQATMTGTVGKPDNQTNSAAEAK